MTEFKRLEIPNFSNYEINSLGEVRNIKRQTLLRAGNNRLGYLQYSLYGDNGEKKTLKLHRLVALAFIPNPDEKPHIDHIDRNKLNNSISNLRWVTRTENNQNASVRKDNKSGVAGVVFCNIKKLWRVSRQRRHLGYFKTMEEAIECRNNSEFI